MKTLEQLLQEEHAKGEIVMPMQERQRIEKVVSRLDDQRFKDVRSQSASDGWWDSPAKYQYVNRNIVSQVQRDTLCYITQALCKHLGVGIGVGGTPIPGVLSVNTKECDIVITDYHLPLKSDSVGYVISNHTLEHIPEPPDVVLREWIRVLKRDGLIALTMPDKRYFVHENKPGIDKYDFAYNEMQPSELKVFLDKLSDVAEVLIFDTNDNDFDINVLIRKK